MVIELSGAIWSEIIRDLRIQVLFQTKIAPLKFNYHLITAILKKGRIQSVLIFGLIAGLLKNASKKAFTSHFVPETEGYVKYFSGCSVRKHQAEYGFCSQLVQHVSSFASFDQ